MSLDTLSLLRYVHPLSFSALLKLISEISKFCSSCPVVFTRSYKIF